MRRWKMEKLNPEKVMGMLHKSGKEITVDEATAVLDFLRLLANITVSQYLEEKANIKTVKNENC
jgi:hypothetical protein